MPVIREQPKVGPVTPGNAPGSLGAEAWARSAAEVARASMSAGASIGNILAADDTEKARKLAEQTVINMDENGVPQVDRSAREKFSKAGRTAYDSTMNARLRTRLSVAMKDDLDDLALQYKGDPEGFAEAAQARLQGMAETVDPEFQAYWVDEAARMGASYGAKLGIEQRAIYEDRARGDFLSAVDLGIENIQSLIEVGKYAEAQAIIDDTTLMGGALINQNIINGNDAREQIQKMRGALHIAKATRDADSWSSTKFLEEADKVKRKDPDYAHITNEATRHTLYSELMTMSGTAAQREGQARKEQEKQADRAIIEGGGGDPNNKQHRALIDEMSGTNALTWTDPDAYDDSRTWEVMIRNGMFSDSFIQASRAFLRPGNASPEVTESMVRTIRGFIDGVAPDGRKISLGADLPEDVKRQYSLLSSYLEYGTTGSITDDDLERAQIFADTYRTKGFNEFSGAFNAQIRGTDWAEWSEDDELISGQLSRALGSKLRSDLGSALDAQTITEADHWFRYMVSSGAVEPNDAYEMMVRKLDQNVPRAYGAINSYGRIQNRDRYAAHSVYAMPGDASFLGRGLDDLFTLREQYEGSEFTVNNHWVYTWMDKAIRDKVLNTPELARIGDDKLIPGVHYALEAIPEDRAMPRFRVWLLEELTNGVTPVRTEIVMDPSADYKRDAQGRDFSDQSWFSKVFWGVNDDVSDLERTKRINREIAELHKRPKNDPERREWVAIRKLYEKMSVEPEDAYRLWRWLKE